MRLAVTYIMYLRDSGSLRSYALKKKRGQHTPSTRQGGRYCSREVRWSEGGGTYHSVVGQHEDHELGPDAGASPLEVGPPHVPVRHLHLAHLVHDLHAAENISDKKKKATKM